MNLIKHDEYEGYSLATILENIVYKRLPYPIVLQLRYSLLTMLDSMHNIINKDFIK